MEQGKFFITLSALSPLERFRFGEFVKSPFFNKNRELIRFYSIIFNKLERGQAIDREKLYNKLYPRKPYDVRHTTDIVYYLNCLLEEFISIEKFRKDEFQMGMAFFAEIHDKDIDKVALSTIREINAILDNSVKKDNDYYFRNYLFFNDQDKYFSAKGKIKQDISLQSKVNNFDIFYLSAKLQDACEMINRRQIVHADYEDTILEKLLEYLDENTKKYETIPAVSIYWNVLRMLRKPEDEIYIRNLLNLLAQHGSLFEKTELRDLYNYAQNFCIRQINAGASQYLQTLFEIYKKLLEDNIIFQGKHLTKWDYKNIISIGLRLKEYEWTLSFINVYNKKLPEEERDNAMTYNLANYYYETGNYKKAVKLLRNVEFTDVYYNLDSKTMLLKIYYDKEEDESFKALVAAFKIYLKRNKLISEHNYVLYKNLVKYTVKTWNQRDKLPYQRGKDFLRQLALMKKKLAEAKNIANVKWLISRIEEIEIDTKREKIENKVLGIKA